MTDHAKQLAEEFKEWKKSLPINPFPLAVAMNFYQAKCLSLMAENERLVGAICGPDVHADIWCRAWEGSRNEIQEKCTRGAPRRVS